MSDYTKATNFTAKDGLPANNSGKIVKGAEIDTEFNAIAAAIASKADSNSPTLTGTPLAPTAASGTNNTQIATTAFVQSAVSGGVPSGCIVLWSGSVASIPSGWYLCNGSNGTPDLRNRFVVGAGSTYSVAATGGSADAIVVSHSHTASSSVSDPGHSHNIQTKYNGTSLSGSYVSSYSNNDTQRQANPGTDSNTTGISVSTTVNSTGSSGTNANLPPYYALAYIMKA